LWRLHTAQEARNAFYIARATFDRISFDLIYSRQNQSMADWEAELTEALEMAVDHLSLYQLTIEQGTRFYDLRRMGKLRGMPDSDLSADMYVRTQEICEAANMPAYEVSNHAKPGSESRHNLIYWRYGDYIGVGPGAHGRITQDGQKFATETRLMPDAWLDAVATNKNGELDQETIIPASTAAEYLMMSLRLNEGTNLGRYRALSGHELSSSKISQLIDDGLLKRDNHSISTTQQGRLLLNAVLRELLMDEPENA
jgi:oxygen-independent coproporphyrinogen-3 oxidase